MDNCSGFIEEDVLLLLLLLLLFFFIPFILAARPRLRILSFLSNVQFVLLLPDLLSLARAASILFDAVAASTLMRYGEELDRLSLFGDLFDEEEEEDKEDGVFVNDGFFSSSIPLSCGFPALDVDCSQPMVARMWGLEVGVRVKEVTVKES